MSSTRVTDRHRPLALQLGQPVRELPDLLVTSPRTARRFQLASITRSRSSRSPVASRKPGDERADLPGLRGSLIIPFPPARAATPAPAVPPRRAAQSRRGGRVRFSGPSARERCSSVIGSAGLRSTGRPRPRTRRPRSRADPGGHPGAGLPEVLRAMVVRRYEGTHRDALVRQQPGHPPDRRTGPPPAAPAAGISPLTRALLSVPGV
jgi:hypothetical protein